MEIIHDQASCDKCGKFNGYNTFNSMVINNLYKFVHLLSSMSHSTSDPHYNVLAGAGFDNDTIVLGQISACDQALKSKF